MSAIALNTDSKDAKLRSDIDRSLRHPVMFFFTSGALWLFVAVILGFLSSFKSHSPEAFGDAGWLTTGRLALAHQNILVYGWACQAAFGAIIWLMARLCRKESKNSMLILMAGHIWNVAVSLGLLGILLGGGKGIAWMAFPTYIWPILLISYIMIVIWSVIQFQVRESNSVYISQWYLLAAIFGFAWIFGTANVFVFLAPKVSGRPIYSYHLALFGFWSLMFIGPWTGFQKLAGAPIPGFLPYVGAAATILFLIPALAVAVNIVRTVLDDDTGSVANSPSLRFILGGMVAMLLMGVSGLFLNTAGALKATQFSLTGYGYEILALYGFFSMCAFGIIYFVVPRVTRREWLSKRFIRSHFFLSVYGVTSIVLFSMFGGLMQGLAQNAYDKPWSDAATRSMAYGVGTTLAWAFIAFANFIFLAHLLMMWARLGRRSSHPTLLDSGHHGDSPHGPEGDIDELQATHS